ncbi:MAG: rRNA maturation RNase YbeY [Eggerthellaceae bacterium]|nr:rRNA maturation RNase YbeY [Eggerthellaceae bacterium]
MNIIVDIQHGHDMVSEVDVAALAQFVLAAEGKPEHTEVGITFVTNEVIQELNALHRGKDAPTDVLSFEVDGGEDGFLSPDAQQGDVPYLLGDIVVACDVALEQTKIFGTTPAQELQVLLVHGLLHICGWDHVHSEEEAEAMEARERELLAAWGLPNIR